MYKLIFSDKLIYIELHKTGSTYTRNILSNITSQEWQSKGKHNTYKDVFKDNIVDFQSKFKIGNIRNPWDWYVSLWAFGCMNKGAIYNRLAKKLNYSLFDNCLHTINLLLHNPNLFFMNRTNWRYLYSDANDPILFRKWLNFILCQSDKKFGIDFHNSSFSKYYGLLTYRYLSLYTYNFNLEQDRMKSYNDVISFDKKDNFLDLIIQTENIEETLLNNSKLVGSDRKEISSIIEKFKTKRNQSSHSSIEEYYTPETIDLVYRKEKFIIDKYDYKFI